MAMRLLVAAFALIIIVSVAAFGAIFSQKTSDSVLASSPPAPAQPIRTVVTVMDESNVPSAGDAAETSAFAAPSPTVTAEIAPARPATPAAAPFPTAAPSPPAGAPPAASSCPGNPNALGVSRVVEIDTTGGPQFGFEHFKTHDFLRPGEVVLTFDDGPWPKNTPAVLAALAAHCTKAIFFPIGLHATYEPGILKQVAAAGHAVGSHTWCHQDLSKTKGRCLINGKVQSVEYDPKDEIEKGVSAVHMAVGGPTAPYFRFPALRHPPELLAYLAQRKIAVFSTDFDSFDFKMRRPEQVRQSVMSHLKKFGKGIILMHDFQHATAEAAMDLLNDLKAGGYKVVFMKPKFPVTTIASYDEAVLKSSKLPSDGLPTSSVVRTISE
jgi:peptidoglycan/xylan/chitin deacetylase (PgdA/CDA1 family)